MIEQCNNDGIVFAVARLESLRAQEAFERSGLYDVLPRDRVFRSVDLALRKLRGTTG